MEATPAVSGGKSLNDATILHGRRVFGSKNSISMPWLMTRSVYYVLKHSASYTCPCVVHDSRAPGGPSRGSLASNI